jgi:hypothetical protein
MSLLLIIFHLPLIAAFAYFVVRQDWPRHYKAIALAGLLLALPIFMMLMWAGETCEAFVFGLGLVLVTLVPANLLAIAIGGSLAWIRSRRG